MVCHQRDKENYQRISSLNQENRTFFDFTRQQYTKYIIEGAENSPTPCIPKIIHQIWLGPKQKPKNFDRWQKTWQQLHPGWEYKLWTDEDVASLNMINQSCFDKETNYGAKSDIMRLEILDQFGGLYIDIDFECIKPFDWIHDLCDFYIGFFQVNFLECKGLGTSARMANGLIASTAGHPLIKKLIQELNAHHGEFKDLKTYYGILARTGPDLVSKVLHEYLAKAPGINIVFPANYFYSWSGSPRLELFKQQETIAIHHYTGSWN